MYTSIKPGRQWLDTGGKPIQAHGFSLFYKDGLYYWYGENKEKTDGKGSIWHWGVRCYTSHDLYNWEDRGLIIPPQPDDLQSPLHPTYCMDRPHIVYCTKTGKYVAWLKIMGGVTSQFMSVLQADEFFGPYEFVHKIYKPLQMDTGDFDLHIDEETGKGYFIFDRPHFEIITAELTDDFTATTGKYSQHYKKMTPPLSREAPVCFERNGKKYLFTSGTTSYTPNPSQVCMFHDYHGEYTKLPNPHPSDKSRTSYSGQITSVLHVPNSDLYIACADRWKTGSVRSVSICSRLMSWGMKQPFVQRMFAPDKSPKTEAMLPGRLQRHKENTQQSTYVFLPIIWQGDNPQIYWQDEWCVEDYMA